jgi:hypothetical protein
MLAALIAASLAAPLAASAQQWQPVTTTRDSTAILVKPSSIKRHGDTVSVLILARYVPANYLIEGRDTVRALTTFVTFDCAREKVKVNETVKYANFDRGRVASRRKPKIPGYGAVFGASMPQVYAHVCAKKK